MRTRGGQTPAQLANRAAERPLVCCGGETNVSVMKRIREVSGAVAAAHDMLAKLYENIADGYSDLPKEAATLRKTALLHRDMAQKSRTLKVPDDIDME